MTNPFTRFQPQLGLALEPEGPPARVPISPGMRFAILARDNHACVYCRFTSGPTQLEVDHVIPVAHGGLTIADNLVASCGPCNAGKGPTPLDKSKYHPGSHIYAIIERAEQAHARVAKARERDEQVRNQAEAGIMGQRFVAYWQERMPQHTMPEGSMIRKGCDVLGLEEMLGFIRKTADDNDRGKVGNPRAYCIKMIRDGLAMSKS